MKRLLQILVYSLVFWCSLINLPPPNPPNHSLVMKQYREWLFSSDGRERFEDVAHSHTSRYVKAMSLSNVIVFLQSLRLDDD